MRFEIGGSKASEGVCCYFYYRYRSFIVVVVRFNFNFFSYTHFHFLSRVPCFVFCLFYTHSDRSGIFVHAMPYIHIVLHRTALNCTTLHYPYHAAAARFHIVLPPPLHHSSFIIHPSIHHLVSVIYLPIIDTCYNAFLFISAPLRAPEHRAPTYPAPPAFSLSVSPPPTPH